MTVPVGMERPCKEAVVKRVKGQLLRREESYTEALEADPIDDRAEDDVVMYLKPSSHPTVPVHNFDAAAPSPNSSPALQRNIRAWCDATGLPTTITIRFKDRVFHLHKFPLVSRSGYLKRMLKEAKEITIPRDAPGGPAIFELVSNFCYGSTILMEPANIAELCCVAEYFQMSEDYGRANLCERSELYLTQVALQSWDDTLVVLQHCESLAPFAEQLGIVRRCLDALAFMACMELLDPVARKIAIPSQNGEVRTSYLYWWIQDLVALPPSLFVKLILALRREGMQENFVGQVITAFADRWIFELGAESGTVLVQKGSDKCWVRDQPQALAEPSVLIESVVRLLPLERHVVPIGFLFALLRRGLTCTLDDDLRIQLETRIVLQLENATLHDLLLPGKKEKESKCVLRNELESMERILKLFLTRFRAFDEARPADMATLSEVAKLWDEYLAEIAFDSSFTPARFADLVDRIPAHMRLVHDHVYRAIHTYLKAHPNATQEERLTVCRTLNCQKLSQEACSHAVQNDLMPLRMIVQAMFMQQLQTRSVLNSHLESAAQSFREHPDNDSHHSRSILLDSATMSYPSAGNSGRHHTCEYSQDSFRSMGSSFRDNDIYIDEVVYPTTLKNAAVRKEISTSGPPKADYQATESRLRSLEAELSRMRKTLSQSLVEESHDLRRQASSSSHQSKLGTPDVFATGINDVRQTPVAKPWSSTPMAYSSRSGLLSTPKMATVHEGGVATGNYCGSSGCMSQMKPVNRTSGLLAKTLQKLKLRSFGKSKGAASKKKSSAPIVDSFKKAPQRIPARDTPRLKSDVGRFVNRTDSMPRPVTSRVKSRHVRHNSMS